MLYREIMAVCSEIHTKHINTLCGQTVELLNAKLAVHICLGAVSSTKVLSSTQFALYVPQFAVTCQLTAVISAVPLLDKPCSYVMPQCLILVLYYTLLPCRTVYICSCRCPRYLPMQELSGPQHQRR